MTFKLIAVDLENDSTVASEYISYDKKECDILVSILSDFEEIKDCLENKPEFNLQIIKYVEKDGVFKTRKGKLSQQTVLRFNNSVNKFRAFVGNDRIKIMIHLMETIH